ncbi:hypothetical protein OGAPHI_001510 [Ogataea philodendri]|uniref:Signal recognition particle receptor subunit alpha homolog n=1 Tax=Ogataea philodendri TaxID=1378263 RepID=A0A9P8PDQ3_9ASCO|nr:uncharacterized protein OGAPHI_001510 [Ogataea philodendri]KAH3669389.1 hypothetical protein OGAPHI_001510 [Ogataea philodendri]
MIDQFLIFRPTGQVEFNYQPGKNLSGVVNAFIDQVLVSERNLKTFSQAEKDEANDIDDEDGVVVGSYNVEKYNVQYLSVNQPDTKLVFAMVHPSVVTLRSPFQFLRKIKVLYLNSDKAKFGHFFDLNLQSLEEKKDEPKEDVKETKQDKDDKRKPKSSKKSRKWNTDGSFYEEDGQTTNLDFSGHNAKEAQGSANLEQLVGDASQFGTKTKTGEFLVNDLSQEMDRILSLQPTPKAQEANSQPFGFLRNLIGGKKITKEDVKKVKSALSTHLIKKNVAPDVANSLISEIEKELVGSTTANFTSVQETAKKSLEKQLIKLLTPNNSIDLLKEIQTKKANKQMPYVISVVGVNGVGKSTNLSKLAYWLLQNNYRVLITACDTFRSGAVEQLRTHVNNLTKLSQDKQQIELFEGGYGGADLVAKIATGAIKYAKQNNFDIVLLDTAGRRHNDTQLMAPLASFAKAANPDKIIMVGEALVGTDSVLQAQNFNKAFGANRHLDFFIVSKCDTVGDLIGSMVNLVYATGIPILFVGNGQTYTDLRTLSVDWAVSMLMS